jgi:hypothetical protein
MGEPIRIVVPSKGRADNVLTTRLVDFITLVVPKSEVDAYALHNPHCKVVAEPDHVKNIVQSRQFILDTYPNVFMLDDDLVAVRKNYIYEGDEYLVTDSDEINSIIQRAADMCAAVGAKMYGFQNLRQPLHYVSHSPIKFTGYLNASYCGFLEGHNLEYDTTYKEGEDHYMSCLNVYRNRYMLIDSRYSFVTDGNFSASGGCQLDRTKTEMLKTTLKLKRTFGDVVRVKAQTTGKAKLREGERTVTFPF